MRTQGFKAPDCKSILLKLIETQEVQFSHSNAKGAHRVGDAPAKWGAHFFNYSRDNSASISSVAADLIISQ